MWRFWLLIGWIIWLVTLAASGSMNFLAGLEFGRTAHEAYVFAALGVAADGWKALGPVFIAVLLREGRKLVALFASLVWIACFIVAVSAALGLAAANRNALTGARESTRITFETLSKELRGLEGRREQLGIQRAIVEIDADIANVLARPVTQGESVRGTVGGLSSSCAKVDSRTATACAEIAALRAELASSLVYEDLARRIAALRSKLEPLRQSGSAAPGDPQAHIIARLTRGLIASRDVGLVLILAMMAMIELVSALSPLVLTEYSRAMLAATRGGQADVAAGRGVAPLIATAPKLPATAEPLKLQQVGGLFDFMADRVRPAESGSVRGRDLYAAYAAWCAEGKKAAVPHKEFFDEFERICLVDLRGSIRRERTRYVGLMLVDEGVTIAALRVQ